MLGTANKEILIVELWQGLSGARYCKQRDIDGCSMIRSLWC